MFSHRLALWTAFSRASRLHPRLLRPIGMSALMLFVIGLDLGFNLASAAERLASLRRGGGMRPLLHRHLSGVASDTIFVGCDA